MGKKSLDRIEKKYSKKIESLYEKSKIYKSLVQLSRITKMVLYLILGGSIFFVSISSSEIMNVDDIVSWLTSSLLGRVAAALLGILLMIYGIEKPRK
jgi:type IV secretory pathway VirB2 component (pilin)